MRVRSRIVLGLIIVIGALVWLLRDVIFPTMPSPEKWTAMTAEQRLRNVQRRRAKEIRTALAAQGLHLGDEVMLRAIKESNELELWMRPQHSGERFRLFKSWPIARWSGNLGPKEREGDGQSPEGFYDVVPERMNPLSSYHLSFNLGYPNAYDLAHERTGSLIMVHGSDVSVGCFAMTDLVIEELYLIVDAALRGGQASVPVHCFPFRMSDERIARSEPSEWTPFWRNLKQGWDAFETTGQPPRWRVDQGAYVFE